MPAIPGYRPKVPVHEGEVSRGGGVVPCRRPTATTTRRDGTARDRSKYSSWIILARVPGSSTHLCCVYIVVGWRLL